MGDSNMLGTEKFAVVATVDPDALTAAQHNSDGVDMKLFESLSVILSVGTLGASATVDMDVTSGSDNVTFGNTVKSITQLTQAGTDSDKQVVVNVRAEDLTEGDSFVRAEVTVAVATSDGAVVILGHNPRYAPASDNDLASVDEIVSS